jgi:hypothetical protein
MKGRLFRLKKSYPDRGFHQGDLVKVVMVSRFEDCGVTKNLEAQNGYDLRVYPSALVPEEPIPADVCPLCFWAVSEHGGQTCVPAGSAEP